MNRRFYEMVGGRRIELLTSSVSRKRSPTELTARVDNPPSIAKGPAAVKGFSRSPICPSRERSYLRKEKSGIISRSHALLMTIAVAA